MKKTSRIIQSEIKRKIYILDPKNSRILSNILNEGLTNGELSYTNKTARARQLYTAYEIGIVAKILESTNRDAFFSNRLIDSIIKDTGYERKVAQWIVETWLDCIDSDVVGLWNKYKAESENESLEVEKIEADYPKEQNDIRFNEISTGIFIPCGVGYDDHGFYVHGIKESIECRDPQESIFAVIFNYLQRNSRIDEKVDKPIYLKKCEKDLDYDLDYRRIYRLMMIILLMVKNNYLDENTLSFNYDGNMKELEVAFHTINNYISLISKLIGKSQATIIKYKGNSNIHISLDKIPRRNGIYTSPNKRGRAKNRIIWFSPKINYKITKDDKKVLEYILKEISDYKSFREGQFEALEEILNARSHKICIMPTGSGKSLIFYISALLQPGVTFVITPTELLIRDQIQSLEKYHRIDDVKALRYNGGNAFEDLPLENRIYYLTPETFQNRNLLKEFIRFNSDKKVANIVLDEVHCISNWSHDFRPEYLMLSTYLNRYLDRTFFLCFTATANYSVIKDIKEQIRIGNDQEVIAPIDLKKHNIGFKFISCDNFIQMVDHSNLFLKNNTQKGRKTLVFTKNEIVSDMLLDGLDDDIRYEAEVFRQSDQSAYRSFTEDKCRILIASEEIGVGINLSEVHSVLHFGLPISKGEYVQEIGRAGRNGEHSSSLVVYLKCTSNNVNERLLQRTSETSEIIEIINKIDDNNPNNDYINTYKKLIGTIDFQRKFSSLLHSIYNRVKDIQGPEEMDFDYNNIINIKRALYILFAIGYINNWSLCKVDYKNNKATILIGLKHENLTLEKIKEYTKNSLYILNGSKSIIAVGRAKSIEEIIDIYNDWYYNHFIYHHREQFLDMLSFFESYSSRDNLDSEINNRLTSYFSLSMLDIGRDEALYIDLSFINIVNSIVSGVDYSIVNNIEKINQDNYNIKLDYFLFIYNLINGHEYESSRMDRILSKLDREMFLDYIESIAYIYQQIPANNKFELFNSICNYSGKENIDFKLFFDMIYRSNEKDLIYYGVLAKEINLKFRGVYSV